MAVLGRILVIGGAAALIVSFFLEFANDTTAWEGFKRADIAFTSAAAVAILLALISFIGDFRWPLALAGVLCALACGFYLSAFEPENPEGVKIGFWLALGGSGVAAIGGVLGTIGPSRVRQPAQQRGPAGGYSPPPFRGPEPRRHPQPAAQPGPFHPPGAARPDARTEALPPTGPQAGQARQPGPAAQPGPGAQPGPAAQSEPAPPPGGVANWYPDPRGEKRLRYYDGRKWTHHVAD